MNLRDKIVLTLAHPIVNNEGDESFFIFSLAFFVIVIFMATSCTLCEEVLACFLQEKTQLSLEIYHTHI